MNTTTMPAEVMITAESACAIAVESWRLRCVAGGLSDTNEGLIIRRSHRQLTEALNGMNIAVVDFVGRPYDPGMAPEVVEVQEDPELQEGRVIVGETISPTVTWHGQVVKAGQITVRRSVSKLNKLAEVAE
jgi:hypothetical protein